MKKNNSRVRARPMTAVNDARTNKAFLTRQDQREASQQKLEQEDTSNLPWRAQTRKPRPQSSQVSTRFTKSSLSKNKKCQQILEYNNSQTQSMRHSQMLFLQRHGSNINQNDTLNVLEQETAPQAPLAGARMFSTFTTSARIVDSVTKQRLSKQHTQTNLQKVGQQDRKECNEDLADLQVPGGDDLESKTHETGEKRRSTGYSKQPPTVAWSIRSSSKLSEAGRPAQVSKSGSQRGGKSRPASGRVIKRKAPRLPLE